MTGRKGVLVARDSGQSQAFQCKRCGNCCCGDGIVTAALSEVARIAIHLGVTQEEFLQSFAIPMADASFVGFDEGQGPDRPCVFLERDATGLSGCRINPVKPERCRAFPIKWQFPDTQQWCAGLLAMAADDRPGPAESSPRSLARLSAASCSTTGMAPAKEAPAALGDAIESTRTETAEAI